jgi:hypothetical protein
MNHDFDTALQVLVDDDGPDPQGIHLTGDQRLGLLEALWEGLKRSPMEAAAAVRAALRPGAEESWREANKKRLESGEETADLDLHDVGAKLARMAGMAGCDSVRAEFLPRRPSGGPAAVRLCAIKDIGGRAYAWRREFMEAELIRMREGLPKYAADVFCREARDQFEAAEEALKHGKK